MAYRDNFNDDYEENDDSDYNNNHHHHHRQHHHHRSSAADFEMTDQQYRGRVSQTSHYGPDMDDNDDNDLNPNLYPLEQTVIPQPYYNERRSRSRCWYLFFGFGFILGLGLIIGFIYQWNQQGNNVGFENTNGLTNSNTTTTTQDYNYDNDNDGGDSNTINNNEGEDVGSNQNPISGGEDSNTDQQQPNNNNNDASSTTPTIPNNNDNNTGNTDPSTTNTTNTEQGGGGQGQGGDTTPTDTTGTDTADAEEIEKWINATVTLADGPSMYTIVKQLDHSSRSFTEGLTYHDGVLYESIGMERESAVLVLDPNTGSTLQQTMMAAQYFGEGLTYVDGKLIQLTYKARTGFVYNASNITIPPISFQYTTTTTEGWGLTYDISKNELIISDGSEYLHFWDPITMQQKRRIQVIRQNNKRSNNINELEYWRERIIANIWYEDTIIVINPETGIVEKEYDFSQLWPNNERIQYRANVLNGISVSEYPDLLYITGKYWDRMFLIRLNY